MVVRENKEEKKKELHTDRSGRVLNANAHHFEYWFVIEINWWYKSECSKNKTI